MKTSERLERAGWIFLIRSGNTDLYRRNGIIILYDNENDVAVNYYNPKDPYGNRIHHMTDVQLDLFCEH